MKELASRPEVGESFLMSPKNIETIASSLKMQRRKNETFSGELSTLTTRLSSPVPRDHDREIVGGAFWDREGEKVEETTDLIRERRALPRYPSPIQRRHTVTPALPHPSTLLFPAERPTPRAFLARELRRRLRVVDPPTRDRNQSRRRESIRCSVEETVERRRRSRVQFRSSSNRHEILNSRGVTRRLRRHHPFVLHLPKRAVYDTPKRNR